MSENYVGIKWLQVWPAILKPQLCTTQTLLVSKWMGLSINEFGFTQTNSSESEAANDNKKLK